MDIQARKIEFMKSFLQIQNEETISKFEELLAKTQDNPRKMTVAEPNKRIEALETDFKNVKFNTSADLLSKYQ